MGRGVSRKKEEEEEKQNTKVSLSKEQILIFCYNFCVKKIDDMPLPFVNKH